MVVVLGVVVVPVVVVPVVVPVVDPAVVPVVVVPVVVVPVVVLGTVPDVVPVVVPSVVVVVVLPLVVPEVVPVSAVVAQEPRNPRVPHSTRPFSTELSCCFICLNFVGESALTSISLFKLLKCYILMKIANTYHDRYSH